MTALHSLSRSVWEESLTPQEYLARIKKIRANIERSHIEPAVLGSGRFGKIQVHYRNPVFKSNSTESDG